MTKTPQRKYGKFVEQNTPTKTSRFIDHFGCDGLAVEIEPLSSVALSWIPGIPGVALGVSMYGNVPYVVTLTPSALLEIRTAITDHLINIGHPDAIQS